MNYKEKAESREGLTHQEFITWFNEDRGVLFCARLVNFS